MIILLTVCVLALLLFGWLHDSGPTYEGKGVKHWVAEYGPQRNSSVLVTNTFNGRTRVMITQQTARPSYPGRDALKKIGPAAVPDLLKILQQKESPLSRFYRSWHPRLNKRVGGWIPNPSPPPAVMRHNAAQALRFLRIEATVPELVALTRHEDPGVRAEAKVALGGFETSKEPLLGALERHFEQGISDVAALDLVQVLDLRGPLAVRMLVQVINGPDNARTLQALVELRELGSVAATAVPSLVQLLRSSNDPETALRVMAVLELCGPAARPSVPLVAEALKDANRETRYRAARVLGSIVRDVEEAIAPLHGAANDRDPMVSNVVNRALTLIE